MSTAPVFYLGQSFFCSARKLDLMKRAVEEQFSTLKKYVLKYVSDSQEQRAHMRLKHIRDATQVSSPLIKSKANKPWCASVDWDVSVLVFVCVVQGASNPVLHFQTQFSYQSQPSLCLNSLRGERRLFHEKIQETICFVIIKYKNLWCLMMISLKADNDFWLT